MESPIREDGNQNPQSYVWLVEIVKENIKEKK